jgi:hypothetical protein
MRLDKAPVKVQHPNILLRWYGDALMWIATKLIYASRDYGTYYEWQTEDDLDTEGCTDCGCSEVSK